MSVENDPILVATLALPAEERAKLADYLLLRVQAYADGEIDPVVIESRIEALRRGESDMLYEERVAIRV